MSGGNATDATRSQKQGKVDTRIPLTVQLRVVSWVGLQSDLHELSGITYVGQSVEHARARAMGDLIDRLGHKHNPITVEIIE